MDLVVRINNLLKSLDINIQLDALSDCVPILWVAIAETLFDERIPGIQRPSETPMSLMEKHYNITVLIDWLQNTIQTDLSHILPISVLRAEPIAITFLVELFEMLSKMAHQQPVDVPSLQENTGKQSNSLSLSTSVPEDLTSAKVTFEVDDLSSIYPDQSPRHIDWQDPSILEAPSTSGHSIPLSSTHESASSEFQTERTTPSHFQNSSDAYQVKKKRRKRMLRDESNPLGLVTDDIDEFVHEKARSSVSSTSFRSSISKKESNTRKHEDHSTVDSRKWLQNLEEDGNLDPDSGKQFLLEERREAFAHLSSHSKASGDEKDSGKKKPDLETFLKRSNQKLRQSIHEINLRSESMKKKQLDPIAESLKHVNQNLLNHRKMEKEIIELPPTKKSRTFHYRPAQDKKEWDARILQEQKEVNSKATAVEKEYFTLTQFMEKQLPIEAVSYRVQSKHWQDQVLSWKRALNDREWRRKVHEIDQVKKATEDLERAELEINMIRAKNHSQRTISKRNHENQMIQMAKNHVRERERRIARMIKRQQDLEKEINALVNNRTIMEERVAQEIYQDYLKKQRLEIIEKRREAKEIEKSLKALEKERMESKINYLRDQNQLLREELKEKEEQESIAQKAQTDQAKRQVREFKEKMRKHIYSVEESLEQSLTSSEQVDRVKQKVHMNLRSL